MSAMEDARILEGINEVARSTFGLKDRLGMATRIADVLELDSLKRLRFAVALEDRFGVVLQRADEPRLDSVADLVALLRKYLDECPS
jgi:acyl carrier protein